MWWLGKKRHLSLDKLDKIIAINQQTNLLPLSQRKVILEILEQINKNKKWAYLPLFIIHI